MGASQISLELEPDSKPRAGLKRDTVCSRVYVLTLDDIQSTSTSKMVHGRPCLARC